MHVLEAMQLDTLFSFQPVASSFHSFGMAYDFIDSVGNDVDVVSDSEVSVVIQCDLGICSARWHGVGGVKSCFGLQSCYQQFSKVKLTDY